MKCAALKIASLPILLIEDEASIMAYVRAALERHGFPVVCSASAVEGLRLLESGEFAGIVSDMRTPGGLDGADVPAWLAQHRPELRSRTVLMPGNIANEKTQRPYRD